MVEPHGGFYPWKVAGDNCYPMLLNNMAATSDELFQGEGSRYTRTTYKHLGIPVFTANHCRERVNMFLDR